jgi:hypothetical protein
MLAIVLKSFQLPVRNLPAVVKLYWPLLLITAFSSATVPLVRGPRSEMVDSSFQMFLVVSFAILVVAYFLVVISASAVGWHRFVVLAESPRWVGLVPRKRAWRYAGRYLLLGAAYGIGRGVVYTLLLVATDDHDAADMLRDGAEAAYTFVFLLAGAEYLLVLPQVSIIDERQKTKPARSLPDRLGRLVIPLFIIYLIGSSANTATDLVISQFIGDEWSMRAVILAARLFGFWSVLAGLTMLSLVYRDFSETAEADAQALAPLPSEQA